MKENKLFIWAFLIITLLILTGCISAGIAKPNVPMSEQSVVVCSDKSIKIKIGDDIFISSNNRNSVLVPSGNYEITVTKDIKYILSSTVQYNIVTTKYIPYTEIWTSEYELKPGLSYKIGIMNDADINFNWVPVTTSTKGVNIKIDEKKIFVIHDDGIDIEIKEYKGGLGGGIAGTTYVGPYINHYIGIDAWSYGPSISDIFWGPQLGLQLIHGKFGMILSGEASGSFIGLGIYGSGNVKMLLGYTYGGFAQFYWPNFGFGLGGGMTGGGFHNMNDTKTDNFFDLTYYFPYAEFDIMLKKSTLSSDKTDFLNPLGSPLSIYVRYFFNDSDKWYNKFALGLRYTYK